jgi:hypothetical protein
MIPRAKRAFSGQFAAFPPLVAAGWGGLNYGPGADITEA